MDLCVMPEELVMLEDEYASIEGQIMQALGSGSVNKRNCSKFISNIYNKSDLKLASKDLDEDVVSRYIIRHSEKVSKILSDHLLETKTLLEDIQEDLRNNILPSFS